MVYTAGICMIVASQICFKDKCIHMFLSLCMSTMSIDFQGKGLTYFGHMYHRCNLLCRRLVDSFELS